MIYHMISKPVTILTPTRDGRLWIRYQDGTQKETSVSELWADSGISEINAAIAPLNASWNWSTWTDPQKWHLQGTSSTM